MSAIASDMSSRTSSDWVALFEVAASLVDAESEGNLVQQVTQAAAQSGDFPLVAYQRTDQNSGTFALLAAAGSRATAFTELVKASHAGIHVSGCPHPRAGSSLTVIGDTAAACSECSWQPITQQLGLRAVVAMPIMLDGTFDGTLLAYATDTSAFTDDAMAILAALSRHAGVGLSRLRAQQQLESALEGTIQALITTVEIRDPYTAGHQKSVSDLACRIADQMGVAQDIREGARLGALTHDIGKMAIPAALLTKPGKLRDAEMNLLREHAKIGEEILSTVSLPWPIATIVGQHHERLDGTGYPRGLRGEEILLESRIITVADVFDAMSTTRPYRAGKGVEVTVEHLTEESGTLFDPDVVRALLDVLDLR